MEIIIPALIRIFIAILTLEYLLTAFKGMVSILVLMRSWTNKNRTSFTFFDKIGLILYPFCTANLIMVEFLDKEANKVIAILALLAVIHSIISDMIYAKRSKKAKNTEEA